MAIAYVQPEFEVQRNEARCIACRVCERQCANEVHRFDEERGIVKLFTPPFTQKIPRAGYINDYPAGVRENGGQYTHAAVWFLTALKKEGMDTEAQKVLHALLPNEKYRSPNGEAVYKTEPYALCGDVYAAPGQEGRGGWSLYTGAAGWLLQYLAPHTGSRQ